MYQSTCCCRWLLTGAYVRGEGGGVGEDAMEAGVGAKLEAEDEEDARLSASCAGLLIVYLRKMRGVRHLYLRPTARSCSAGRIKVARCCRLLALVEALASRSHEEFGP